MPIAFRVNILVFWRLVLAWVLTKYLIVDPKVKEFKVVDYKESVDFNSNFPSLCDNIFSEDFLRMNLENLYPCPFSIIGNFPGNISNQILFKLFENRDKVKLELVGMFQKEVAERVCSKSGNKVYGILSVLLRFILH